MAKPRKKRAPAAPRRKKKAAAPIVELSIGAGNPLQPGGLAEYLTALRSQGAGVAKEPLDPAEANARKAARQTALKAAQARWSTRQKPK